MKPLHLLSDFDGVWTEPAREYAAVQAKVVAELALALGESEERSQRRYQEYSAAVMRQPDKYGWQANSQDLRLSSYVDEDYFCLPAAIGQLIDQGDSLDMQEVKEAVLGRYDSVIEMLDHCFHSTCTSFRQQIDHDLTQGAEPVLQWMLDHEIAVTWATNAPAEKIISWFAHHGFEVFDALETEPSVAPLRVYGRAGKQWLGDSADKLSFAGRDVWVDRPQYRKIIERECPDLVVGDVLSLDLALPLAMRLAGHQAAPQETALLYRRDTPDWVLQSIGSESFQVDHLISHLTSVPRLLLGLMHGEDSCNSTSNTLASSTGEHLPQ